MFPFLPFPQLPKTRINYKLTQIRSQRFRNFSSNPSSKASRAWHQSPPNPSKFKSDYWGGRGGTRWEWARPTEGASSSAKEGATEEGCSLFSSSLNGAHQAWYNRHERKIPRGFCAKFDAAFAAGLNEATGGVRRCWSRRGGRGGSGEGGAKDWKNGTGSGPFNWEAFERDFTWPEWKRGRHGHDWATRFFRDARERRRKCRGAKWVIAHRARNCEARRRATAGFWYLTLTGSPQPSPTWRGSSLLRPTLGQLQVVTVPPFPSSTPPPPPRPPPHYTKGPYTFHLKTSVLGFPVTPFAPATSVSARLFSTLPPSLPPREPLECALPIFFPLAAILKSTAALNVISIISRVALTLLPISARAKLQYIILERYRQNPDAAGWIKRFVERSGVNTDQNLAGLRLNATFILPLLAFLPIILLGATVAASYERTPITGRPRIVMLSPEEEAELVTSVLSVGGSPEPGSRDWVVILRNVLGVEDEGISPTTGRRIFLGGEVLDARDWRVRWTEAVLRALESGIQGLATRSPSSEFTPEGVLSPPPNNFPLGPRPAHLGASPSGESIDDAQPFFAEYDLVVIDRQEPNAFSFGFGPDEPESSIAGRRGVVVVYTGFISEILGETYVPSTPIQRPPQRPPTSLFSNFFSTSSSRRPVVEDPLPNLVPTTLPTPAQTKSLAVLLSHELAHLVLSHTLESYASTSLLLPHISKMFSDIVRTFLYPVTFVLGPFLNDAIGRSMNEGASGNFGVFGQALNSCSSRILEGEADLVALRLLALSGIDPRFALNFWEQRLENPSPTSSPDVHQPKSHLLRLHSDGRSEAGDTCGFLSTHPVNADRIKKIKDELDKWIAYNALKA